MAKYYGTERSKYGNLTGQIIIWPHEIPNNSEGAVQKEILPAGYLRCDGSVYNVNDYPQLAAICGAGQTGKFIRRNLANEPLQVVNDQQFVVPDLGSKYPKPTTGPDAGQYKSVREMSGAGNEVNRSGIGIEASSTIGTTVEVTYTGVFNVPIQEINMRGRPSWTIGTTLGRRTDAETVDQSGLHGHMHFHAGKRTRLKATNEVDASSPNTYLDPRPMGMVSFFNASTIPLEAWLEGHMDPTGNNYPGNNQPPCRAIASSHHASNAQFPWGDFSGTSNPIATDPTAYGGACWNDDEKFEDTWKYICLLPSESWMSSKGLSTSGSSNTRAWTGYPIGSTATALNGVRPNYRSATWVLGGCIPDGAGEENSSQNVEAAYLQGGPGVPNDWKDASLYEVVPMQMNDGHAQSAAKINPGLYNEFSETPDLGQDAGDPTAHFHRVSLDKGTHTYKMLTDAVQISPDNLTTTLNLAVDDAVSIDSVASPFIVLEYLIKF